MHKTVTLYKREEKIRKVLKVESGPKDQFSTSDSGVLPSQAATVISAFN